MSVHDYQRIERAIHFLHANHRAQPSLAEVAAHVKLSDYHFQRLFRRWAGVSPKRFLQYLTADDAKRRLREAASVLDVTDGAGLSSGGRLHDVMVTLHAASPGEWKHGGAGLTIRYGFHASPFGECLIAATARGVCALRFVAGAREPALAELAAEWPGAVLRESVRATRHVARVLFGERRAAIALHVRGSNFQIKVWEALLTIPSGALISYGALAQRIDAPRAARAVGTAVGQNPVALLIPCHRVIRDTGVLGNYRWGSARKSALLAWEAARRDSEPGDALSRPVSVARGSL